MNCRNEIFSFTALSTIDLHKLVFNSNNTCLCSKRINVDFLHDLPRFEIISKLKDSTASLANIDTEINFPSQTNFKYYSSHEFHDSSEIKSTISNNPFSTLHCNIRSLFANFELFTTMLVEINYPFSVIGLSEIKTKEKGNVMNTSLPGYTFYSKTKFKRSRGRWFFHSRKSSIYSYLRSFR